MCGIQNDCNIFFGKGINCDICGTETDRPQRTVRSISDDYRENLITIIILFVAGTVFSTPAFSPWFRRNKNRAIGIIVLFVIFWASVTMLVDSAYNPFLYFRF